MCLGAEFRREGGREGGRMQIGYEDGMMREVDERQ